MKTRELVSGQSRKAQNKAHKKLQGIFGKRRQNAKRDLSAAEQLSAFFRGLVGDL